MNKKPSICIVAHYAYGAINGGSEGHAGGVERQTSLFAKWLASKGYCVSIVVWGNDKPENEIIDGVTVIKICSENAGIPGLRFFYPRWTSLISALKKADADIYYHNCGEYVTGQIAFWCKHNSKKFVFSVASDMECSKELSLFNTMREKILYVYGIKNAHKIICQTRNQQTMLLKNFDLESTPVPMPCPGPDDEAVVNCKTSKPTRHKVLWVARIHKVKRLEFFVEVASRMPDIEFVVAGKARENDDYIKNVLDLASKQSNISMLGMVERDRLGEIYCQASALCCTSSYEGFPNTFLEAWSYGLPVVTTVDPDGIIQQQSLGCFAATVDDMVLSLESLFNDKNNYDIISNNVRSYFLNNHEMESSLGRFEALFNQLEIE